MGVSAGNVPSHRNAAIETGSAELFGCGARDRIPGLRQQADAPNQMEFSSWNKSSTRWGPIVN